MTVNAYKENYSDVKTGEYLSRMLELMRSAKDYSIILSTYSSLIWLQLYKLFCICLSKC